MARPKSATAKAATKSGAERAKDAGMVGIMVYLTPGERARTRVAQALDGEKSVSAWLRKMAVHRAEELGVKEVSVSTAMT